MRSPLVLFLAALAVWLVGAIVGQAVRQAVAQEPLPARVVREYTLPLVSRPTIPLPEGAEILTVATQGKTALLWAEDTGGAPGERELVVVGTGEVLPADAGQYIGTIQIQSALGWLEYHVYTVATAP